MKRNRHYEVYDLYDTKLSKKSDIIFALITALFVFLIPCSIIEIFFNIGIPFIITGSYIKTENLLIFLIPIVIFSISYSIYFILYINPKICNYLKEKNMIIKEL